MPRGRHAYVQFYPSDWMAGTARLNRLLHSMYFDVCLHNWDRAEVMSKAQQTIVFADVDGWQDKVQALIDMGKLKRTQGGGLYCERAINEARSSNERYSISVASGRDGAAKRWKGKEKLNGVPNGVAVANQNQNQNQREKITPNPFVLPEWVPPEPWAGLMEMRGRMRFPRTDRVKKMLVKDLADLKAKGHDPGKVLDLTTMKGWRAIYPGKNGETMAKGKTLFGAG